MATQVKTRLSHPAPEDSVPYDKLANWKSKAPKQHRIKKADICNVEPVSQEELQKVLTAIGSGLYYWDTWDECDEAETRWTITDAEVDVVRRPK